MGSNDEDFKSRSYYEAHKKLTQSYEHLLQDLSILKQMEELDDPYQDINDISLGMVETIAFGLAAENCSLMLLDDSGEYLELRSACSPLESEGKYFNPGDWIGKKFKIGEGIVGQVALTGESIKLDDVSKEYGFVAFPKSKVSIRSLMSFPLKVEGKVVGVLNLSHSEPGFFSIEHENTLRFVAERAARILSNHLIHKKLKESEEHHRLISDNAGDGILVFDKNWNILDVNPVVEKITSTPVSGFIAGESKWEDGVFSDDKNQFEEHKNTFIETLTSNIIEYRYVDALGNIHYLEQKNSPICDNSGKLQKIISVVRDSTERIKADKERKKT